MPQLQSTVGAAQNIVSKAAKFTSLSYSFATLLRQPKPDQESCSSSAACPIWDGTAIYREKDVSIKSVKNGKYVKTIMNKVLKANGDDAGSATLAEASGPQLWRPSPCADLR